MIAIDWSGAKGERRKHAGIAVAEWTPDFNLNVEVGFSREALIERLEVLVRDTPHIVVGFDFSFSFPEWFAIKHGKNIAEVWQAAGDLGEQWLADLGYPFWSRKRWPKREGEPWLRNTELSCEVGKPKSIFQLVGNGQVGPGSVRGMKYLAQLRKAGFAVWPFDAGRLPLIVEVYPSDCYTNGKRSSADILLVELNDSGFNIGPEASALLRSSGDARDAACALMRMVGERDSFAALPSAMDATTLLEGSLWRPNSQF